MLEGDLGRTNEISLRNTPSIEFPCCRVARCDGYRIEGSNLRSQDVDDGFADAGRIDGHAASTSKLSPSDEAFNAFDLSRIAHTESESFDSDALRTPLSVLRNPMITV